VNTVTAATQCGGDVHVPVAGTNAGGAAAAAAQIAGVAKVLHADAPGFEHALAAAYSHILFVATASGKNIARRVAATLDFSVADYGLEADLFEAIPVPLHAL